MEGGGHADGGRNEVNGVVEGDWRAGGCRSWAEVTGGRAGNRPSRVAVRKSRDRLCMMFASFVLTNLVVLLNLKNREGVSHTHVANNGGELNR